MGGVLEELEEKSGLVAELTERLEDVQEENNGLRQDIADLQERDVTNRRQILDVADPTGLLTVLAL